MRRRLNSQQRTSNRAAFTLIELLVVIVILALLIGLLVPAVMQAVGKAKDASCAAEIRTMSQSLASFQSKHQCYPPSRIVINESGDYTTSGLGIGASLGPRTLTYLRRIWPRMQFNTSGTPGFAAGLSNSPGKFYDVNGDGVCNPQAYILEGHQCLVLFLGGVPQSTGAGWSMTGFSKNPSNPFQTADITTNRTQPEFEFANGRLFGTGFPGYIDTFGPSSDGLTPFYAYFSAYEGTGYDADDVNGAEASSDGAVATTMGAFTSGNMPASTPPITTSPKVFRSAAPNPYTSDPPVANDANGDFVPNYAKSPAWINGQTFQIISSGRDRAFGIGGQYLPNGNNRLPFENVVPGANTVQSAKANATVTGQTLQPDARASEKDNITNFSAGTLD